MKNFDYITNRLIQAISTKRFSKALVTQEMLCEEVNKLLVKNGKPEIQVSTITRIEQGKFNKIDLSVFIALFQILDIKLDPILYGNKSFDLINDFTRNYKFDDSPLKNKAKDFNQTIYKSILPVCITIIGPLGSGKTTLINSLLDEESLSTSSNSSSSTVTYYVSHKYKPDFLPANCNTFFFYDRNPVSIYDIFCPNNLLQYSTDNKNCENQIAVVFLQTSLFENIIMCECSYESKQLNQVMLDSSYFYLLHKFGSNIDNLAEQISTIMKYKGILKSRFQMSGDFLKNIFIVLNDEEFVYSHKEKISNELYGSKLFEIDSNYKRPLIITQNTIAYSNTNERIKKIFQKSIINIINNTQTESFYKRKENLFDSNYSEFDTPETFKERLQDIFNNWDKAKKTIEEFYIDLTFKKYIDEYSRIVNTKISSFPKISSDSNILNVKQEELNKFAESLAQELEDVTDDIILGESTFGRDTLRYKLQEEIPIVYKYYVDIYENCIEKFIKKTNFKEIILEKICVLKPGNKPRLSSLEKILCSTTFDLANEYTEFLDSLLKDMLDFIERRYTNDKTILQLPADDLDYFIKYYIGTRSSFNHLNK